MAIPEAELITAGLYDPSGPNAAERLELIRWNEARGFELDEMVEAFKECRLTSLVADRQLRGGPCAFTRSAVRQALGVAAEDLDEISLASGFPIPPDDQVVYTEADLETFRVFVESRRLFSQEEALNFLRVLGSSIGRITDAAVSLFLSDVESPLVASGGTELELAQKNELSISALELVIGAMDPLTRRHMTHAIDRARTARMAADDPDLFRYAIGFVDLVGFTPLASEVSPRELGVVVREFEGRAHEMVTRVGGRVVKLIGDEVMFVAVEPDAACAAAAGLMSAFGDQGGITPRGAITYGDIVSKGGDYYGPVVNLASRIADLAVPHEMLVTAEVVDRASSFGFEPAGRRMLKGFADPVAVFSLVV